MNNPFLYMLVQPLLGLVLLLFYPANSPDYNYVLTCYVAFLLSFCVFISNSSGFLSRLIENLRQKRHRHIATLIIVVGIICNGYFGGLFLLFGVDDASRVSFARGNIAMDVLRHGANTLALAASFVVMRCRSYKLIGLYIFTVSLTGSKSAVVLGVLTFAPAYFTEFKSSKMKVALLLTLIPLLYIVGVIFANLRSGDIDLARGLLNRIDWYYIGFEGGGISYASEKYSFLSYHLHHLSQLLGFGRLYDVPIGTAVAFGDSADSSAGGGVNSNLILAGVVFGLAWPVIFIQLSSLPWLAYLFIKISKENILTAALFFSFPIYFIAVDLYIYFGIGAFIVFLICRSILFLIAFKKVTRFTETLH